MLTAVLRIHNEGPDPGELVGGRAAGIAVNGLPIVGGVGIPIAVLAERDIFVETSNSSGVSVAAFAQKSPGVPARERVGGVDIPVTGQA